jgi:hypothetical protein
MSSFGAVGGAILGCEALGAGGTMVLPGIGTIGGCIYGGMSGSLLGAGVGLASGALIGSLVCSCEGGGNTDLEFCRKLKAQCIEKCLAHLGSRDYGGAPFFRCVKECLAEYGCDRYWK